MIADGQQRKAVMFDPKQLLSLRPACGSTQQFSVNWAADRVVCGGLLHKVSAIDHEFGAGHEA
jgi:hypothetical protein